VGRRALAAGASLQHIFSPETIASHPYYQEFLAPIACVGLQASAFSSTKTFGAYQYSEE
jgi:hypothetical protein